MICYSFIFVIAEFSYNNISHSEVGHGDTKALFLHETLKRAETQFFPRYFPAGTESKYFTEINYVHLVPEITAKGTFFDFSP